jgi:hypothetical protein
MPGAKIVPVTCGAKFIAPPTDFDWHEWEDGFFLGKNTVEPVTEPSAALSTNQSLATLNMAGSLRVDDSDQLALAFAAAAWEKIAYAGTTPTTAISSAPLPGWSNNDVTFIQVQGMDINQPVIVETRTCCEYTLAFNSPCARFAKDSPKSRPAAMKQVMDIARRIPAALPDDHSWLDYAFGFVKDVAAGPVGQLARGMAKLAISSFAPPLAPLAVGW